MQRISSFKITCHFVTKEKTKMKKRKSIRNNLHPNNLVNEKNVSVPVIPNMLTS